MAGVYIKPYKPWFNPYDEKTGKTRPYPEDYFDDDPNVELVNGSPQIIDAKAGMKGRPAPFRLNNTDSICSDKHCLARVEIYAKEIYGITSFTMDKLIKAARKHLKIDKSFSLSERITNFAAFEINHLNRQDPWGNPLEGIFHTGTSAYKNLKLYSETDYGSLMINRINESESNFIVYSAAKRQAMASSDYIRLPPDYPKLLVYPFSNQAINPQATIHHEFEHTRFGSRTYSIGSLVEEVAAVVEFENPARIIDGFEPRYVYYQSGSNQTVSIFDHTNIMAGGRTFDSNDPRILR